MSRMTPLVRAFVQQGKVAECPIIDIAHAYRPV